MSSTFDPFPILFFNLQDNITGPFHEKLLDLLQNQHITRAQRENCKSVYTLLDTLHQRGHIARDNVNLLLEMFGHFKREDLLDIVRDYIREENLEEQHSDCEYFVKEPPHKKHKRNTNGPIQNGLADTSDSQVSEASGSGISSKSTSEEILKQMVRKRDLKTLRKHISELDIETRIKFISEMDAETRIEILPEMDAETRSEYDKWTLVEILPLFQEELKKQYRSYDRRNLDYGDVIPVKSGRGKGKTFLKNRSRRTLVELEERHSALANNMALDWAEGNEFQENDLLFALNLRDVSGGAQLADIIIDQLLPGIKKEDLQDVLTALEDKIMIVLDVIDESQEVVRKGQIADLIHGDYLPNATVVVNSMTMGRCRNIGRSADQHYKLQQKCIAG